MSRQKQLFGFGMPIKDILKMCENDNIHVFWKDDKSHPLGYNDVQKKLLQQKLGLPDFIGKDLNELCVKPEIEIIIANNNEIMANNITKCFIEKIYDLECLSLKSQLKNSANNTIGIIGLSFYFNEISLYKTAGILSKLNFTTQQSNSAILLDFNIKNEFILSNREKECAEYILQGMTAKKIGRILNISNRTVEKHIDNIKRKLGCNNSSQIISKILEVC